MSDSIIDCTAELLHFDATHEALSHDLTEGYNLHINLRVERIVMSRMFEPDFDPLKRMKVRVRIEEVE